MIRAEHLTRRFGERMAVDDLSFQARPGEILGLLGPNGGGKTTTIRMLAGIIAPTSGAASVAGVDPACEPERAHEKIGLLTEAPGFYERLSAARNLAYFAGFYQGLDVRRSVERCLSAMSLLDRAQDRVGTFSNGMKQRLALARTLLHDPPILFLDEPTAGLDPQVAKHLRDLIIRLRSAGRTILLSTHNLAEAEALCDRIAILRTRLVALGTAQELRQQHFAPQVRVRVGNLSDKLVTALSREPIVESASRNHEDPTMLQVRLHDLSRDRAALVSRLVALGADVLDVRVEEQSLEDAYLKLVQEEEE
ncbi:MAG: ABC transporter ATP-binding protein [Candidatus Bipolaricaulaceae bacterium]